MKISRLTYSSIDYYKRYYKLIASAALITVGVITGSLVVGDSVRTTLIKRVTERLGDTETIIFSRNSFLDESILESAVLNNTTRGVLLTNGFISHGGQLIPVFVWGIDDMSIAKGAARINTALLNEMGIKITNTAIVLRLPATGLVPSGSLFVTENYTVGMRLDYDGIVDIKEGGNISLKNEQTIPLNIFVNRSELAEVMKIERKINLLLSNKEITAVDMEQAWDYSLSGISVNRIDTESPANYIEITSDRIFLQREVVETICKNNRQPNRLFSYLANSIERENTSNSGEQESVSIPYSFVTAMDRYKGEYLQSDEIILSDYSANRINARTGDIIKITYFTSKDLKTLQTCAVSLRVKKIIPLTEILGDKTLSAEFPGLTDVETCTDWDSDLPINMDLITDEDEKYWELYRSAPKAIIAYNAVAGDWSNEYGIATAIRFGDFDMNTADVRLNDTDTEFETNEKNAPNLSELHAGMFGIQLIYPRAAGIYAAKNGVDFSSLFLALGCFIIFSAILLMIVPLSEMLTQRKREISLLKALGYSSKRITILIWRESAPVVFTASIAGIIAGIIYTSLIMWLLGNLWKGATHTGGFSVYPDLKTLIIGSLIGFGLSFVILYGTIKRNLKEKRLHHRVHNDGKTAFLEVSLTRKKLSAILSICITIGLTVINILFLNAVVLFVITGLTILITATIIGDYIIYRKGSVHSGGLNAQKLIWSTLYANKKQVILSFFALATGVFIVFSVGLNRKGFENSAQLRTGTGGYSLWCESSVPVYHNMMTREGREKLSLTSLPAGVEILQCLRLSADDASCLNLNKVITPSVLGVDMTALSESDLQIEQNIYSLNSKEAFKKFHPQIAPTSPFQPLSSFSPLHPYPALVDATVLTWSLGMKLGDTLFYENDRGQSIAIQLAGILPNTIFQGHILIDKRFFSEIWEELTGSEFFLLKTAESEKEEVKTLLSQALNEYGIRVTTTNDRLKQFNSVTDTYLTIFMTLGGIGLLLGIMSFIIVIRKSLAARRNEIDLYKTLGFTKDKIEQTLYKENLIVPLYAIATGVISSLAGVGTGFMNTGTGVWIMALLFSILFILCVVLFVKKSVKNEIYRSNQLSCRRALIWLNPALFLRLISKKFLSLRQILL